MADADLVKAAIDSLAEDIKRITKRQIVFKDGKAYTAENFYKFLENPNTFTLAVEDGWEKLYKRDINKLARKIYFGLKNYGGSSASDEYELVFVTNPNDVITNHKQFLVYGSQEKKIYPEIAPTTHPHLFDCAHDNLRSGEMKKFYLTNDRKQLKKVTKSNVPGVGLCHIYNLYEVPEYRRIEFDREDKGYLALTRIVQHVIPDKVSRDRFYDWISLSLESRCRTMLVLKGFQRIGKTLLLQLAQALHGFSNCTHISQDFGNQRFNDNIYQKSLAIGDEFRLEDAKGYERMKALVEDRITVEQKGKAEHTVQNVTSFILASNLPNLLPLNGSTDRKFDYLDLAKVPPPPELVEDFVEALACNGGEPDLQAIRGLYERLKKRHTNIDHAVDFRTVTYEECLYESIGTQKRYLIDLCLGNIDVYTGAFFGIEDMPMGEIPYELVERAFIEFDKRRRTFLQPSTAQEFLRYTTWNLKPLATMVDDDGFKFIRILQGPNKFREGKTWGDYQND